ncbi:MAG: bacterioferritin, partial [gamma proteobacterium symbiont of Ctena orbiculata]
MYEKSIELLNQAVADELTAVHQYMYFHFHCDDQGIELLSALFKRTAIEEMMHIERLAD